MSHDQENWLEERARLLSRMGSWQPFVAPIHRPDAELRITLATAEEAAVVHRIIMAAFAELAGALDPPSGASEETPDDVRKTMQEGGSLLAHEGDLPIGSARFRLDPANLYIGRIAVLPEHWGRGIASAMLTAVEEVARTLDRTEIRLGTRQTLAKNIALYQRAGYEIVDIHKHPRGSDMVVWLVKRLAPPAR